MFCQTIVEEDVINIDTIEDIIDEEEIRKLKKIEDQTSLGPIRYLMFPSLIYTVINLIFYY